MKITRLFALLTLLIAFSLVFATWQSLKNQTPQVVSTGEALVGGPFELTAHTGNRLKDSDFAGKYMLIYFGYTFCPDICPAELQVISAALDELGDRAADIQPLFVSVDPERDNVEVMKEYVTNFHPSMIGLTGSAKDIKQAAASYRVYYAKAGTDAGPGEYLMDHTSIVYLMGKDGKFIKHFSYGTSVEKLVDGLSSAMAEN